MSYLTQKEYNISGNVFRAFYDAAGKLVFVIDDTVTDSKLNALLVINPVGDRKWDDILSNDYGVDLETVRPKKDNKYQKLDIEYSGLSVYDDLIHSVGDAEKEPESLEALNDFRQASIRKSAQERLEVAETKAEKTRETILKTNESITELQSKLKVFRSTLSQQRKQIGKEPTKKSAAKILRTEAQIDATNEKIRRAKKRLANAQRRLVSSEEDAELARDVLARISVDSDKSNKKVKYDNLPAVQKANDIVVKQSVPVPTVIEEAENVTASEDVAAPVENTMAEEDYRFEVEQDFSNDTEQQKAINMADEEVKPLFDKDPEILDEEIAFKPIDFGVSKVFETTPEVEKKEEKVIEDSSDVAPLSFVPPVSNVKSEEKVEETAFAPIEIKPVTDYQFDNNAAVNDVNDAVNNVGEFVPPVVNQEEPKFMPEEPKEPVVDNSKTINEMPKENNASNNVISPAPVSSDFRPVSPITGVATPAAPVQRKPTLLYYVMLIMLIALSIFTLWLYQKKTASSDDSTPDLIATVPQPEVVTDSVVSADNSSDAVVAESPFIEPVSVEEVPEQNTQDLQEETQITVSMPESKVEEVEVAEVEPEPVPVTPVVDEVVEEMPVVVPEVSAEPVVVQPVVQTPAPLYEEPKPVIQTEEEIIASKPAYNVSQNEKMFVADSEYETDSAPYYEEPVVEDMPLCPDGATPDMNGCCVGEVYTDMGEYGFNCCPEAGGDCFPPLF